MSKTVDNRSTALAASLAVAIVGGVEAALHSFIKRRPAGEDLRQHLRCGRGAADEPGSHCLAGHRRQGR